MLLQFFLCFDFFECMLRGVSLEWLLQEQQLQTSREKKHKKLKDRFKIDTESSEQIQPNSESKAN